MQAREIKGWIVLRPQIAGGTFALFIWAAIGVLFVQLIWHSHSDNYPFDLAYFFTAGRMWSAGVDPYGPAFVHWAARYIEKDVALWAYPPQWWVITTTLGKLDDTAAVLAWKAVNLAALVTGGALLLRSTADLQPRLRLLTGGAIAALLATADATRITLHLGQTSLLMLLGFAALIDGVRTTSRPRQVLGLALLMLKPQFGLFFLLLAASGRDHRPAALWAILITAVACLPILLTFGVGGTIASARHLLANLAHYSALPWNRAGELTGLSYFLAVAGLRAPSPLACIGAAWLVTLWACRTRAFDDRTSILTLGLGVMQFLVPLHPYDFVLLPAFLLAAPTLRPWAVAAIIAANLLLWRVSTLAFDAFLYQTSDAFGGVLIGSLIQAGVATVAAILVLAALLFGRNTDKREKKVVDALGLEPRTR